MVDLTQLTCVFGVGWLAMIGLLANKGLMTAIKAATAVIFGLIVFAGCVNLFMYRP